MVDWNESLTWDRSKGKSVSKGFSKAHAKLLDVCFGHYSPPKQEIKNVGVSGKLEESDIKKLAFMVLAEFASSVEKERTTKGEETKEKSDPRPYDVFAMKNSSTICVVLPLKESRLVWWDGDEVLKPLEECLHDYRIASLSGSARVLQCLLDRMLESRNSLSTEAMKREKLWTIAPEMNSMIEKSGVDPSILGPLNHSQKLAVATVANESFQDGFFAIQGPPGCGKTTTMVGMISAIADGMVVTAPSNAAVANLGLKRFATNRYSFPDICVYGDGCDESISFLNPCHRSDAYRKASRARTKLNEKEIKPGPHSHKLTKKRDRKMDQVRKGLAKWLHVDENLSFVELRRMCPYVPTDRTDPKFIPVLRGIISRCKVLLCTLNALGSSFVRKLASSAEFSTLLLDEGGQCTEAEFFLATTLPGIRRIVVMGDPNQLPPTVLEPKCSAAGFGNSWLGNVYKLSPDKVHLLDTQYRMHPDILKFPNQRFYNDCIRSGNNVLDRSPSVQAPFRLIDTHGQGSEKRCKLSYRNSHEISVIQNVLKTDTDIKTILKANNNARIIIITPYKAQVLLLQQMTRGLGYRNMEVSTVDSFQGQEGDIVIVSTVRTKSVGFVDHGQRLNVALTRAKRVLRVVGDQSFFEGLGRKSTLRALVDYSKAGGHVEKSTIMGTAKQAGMTSDHNASSKKESRRKKKRFWVRQSKQG